MSGARKEYTDSPPLGTKLGKGCPRWCQVIAIIATVAAGAAVIGVAIHFSLASKTKDGNQDDKGQLTGKAIAPYGSWVSPIDSDLMLKDYISIAPPLIVDPLRSDTVYWVEARPSEGGRHCVCSVTAGDVNFTTWTPLPYDVSSGVHEYGGGAFFVYNATVYFSNNNDQRLYVQESPTALPDPLTIETGGSWRYADGQYVSKDGQDRIFIVREDHTVITRNESKEAENTIVVIDLDTRKLSVLVEGADFYSSPRVSPDGKRICWFQWNHPNMPWDSTALWVAQLNETLNGLMHNSSQMVAGGMNISVMEPRWTAENTLLYIGDQTDWWNLYHVTTNGDHVNLAPQKREIGGPHWRFGVTSYDVKPAEKTKQIVTAFAGKLAILDLTSNASKPIQSGYRHHSAVRYGDSDHVFCLASDPRKASAVLRINVKKGKVDVVRSSTSILDTLDTEYLSSPKEVEYTTGNNEVAYAFYYRPQSKDYEAPNGSLPPLLVQVHGGPTGQTHPDLRLGFQYYTSRGFGVLDLNYRGSTGYGRPYRTRLYNNWGITDHEDAALGAKYIADSGRADLNKLCIGGGSAGGYTALASMAFQPDVFKAACSKYGIGDLELLAKETHKFESRYLDKLIGPYPEMEDIYKARSPINHLENIKTPCIFFQGDQDKVVPPNQAELMFNALKNRSITTAFILYEGEKHGFQKAKNIRKTIDGEYFFYSQIFGFNAPSINVNITIANAPTRP